jgi:hypothetical protein
MAHVLVDVKDRMELPPSRLPNIRIPVNRDGETTFPVYKSDNPVRIELKPRPCSFLLIVPTRHIFTAHLPDPRKRVRQLSE